MKNLTIFLLAFLFGLHFVKGQEKHIFLSKEELKDKIKGGWAGQTIGVTFGGPTEFQFCGTMVNDYQPIVWYDGYLKKTMEATPGLYDDIYMDLTFVDIFEKEGLDAPVTSFAKGYANAGYVLWHANQVGRYNILHNIASPESGHWLNNPHADCIDYQIESDFSGLMSPGMPNTAGAISDKIGHIMNYGDGWYGGVFVGAMYSVSFTSKNINYIVKEALKTIPSQSEFYKCISDVILWHQKYPNDWKSTWFEIQKKWTSDIGCPDGVFRAFNIDAKVNAAYVVLGLLYGQGDFSKTLEISTRAGQDSDCNPSSAGGILGTILGYKNIPAYWKMGLKESEQLNFKYTAMSLEKVYDISFNHAIKNIQRNKGTVEGDKVTIAVQQPIAVRFEKSFEGHYPVKKINYNYILKDEFGFDFEGIGFVITGGYDKWDNESKIIPLLDVIIDGGKVETVELPQSYITRRHELFWKYQLPKGKHTVKFKVRNLPQSASLKLGDLIIYNYKPDTSQLGNK